jgi:thioredoxin 1
MNLTEFQQNIAESKKPIMVDFWATWCAPCRMTKPILDKLAGEYQDTVEFIPVNTDESPEVAKHFRIMGIPTVLALREGQVVSRVTGAQNEAGYRGMFEALAQGTEIKVQLSPFNRFLRLGAGATFLLVAFSTSNWIPALIGGLFIFLGVYDRCPVWKALTGIFPKKTTPQVE